MAHNQRKPGRKPTWSELKNCLTGLDRDGLLKLVRDLYDAGKANRDFLHARFGLGDNVLEPYKAAIYRWVCPDVLKNQDVSVSRAKRAISSYRKAIGRPEGMAELRVFYCEACADLLAYCGMDDEDYFTALVRMFEEALKAAGRVEPPLRRSLIERLERVRLEGRGYGYGVGDDMDCLMEEYGRGEG